MYTAPVLADPVTPSENPSQAINGTQPSQNAAVIGFEQASAQVTSVLPLALDKFDQAVIHSYNWKGIQDASCRAEIGFGPQALVISGQINDDFPLVQSRVRPVMEDWWKITYGADGLEIQFDDPTSAPRKLKLLFNFSSAGTSPHVEVLQSPARVAADPSPGSELTLTELPAALRQQGTAGFKFRAVIPIEQLAEPSFFSGPLHIVSKLHDMDGDSSTYLMLQDVIEKP